MLGERLRRSVGHRLEATLRAHLDSHHGAALRRVPSLPNPASHLPDDLMHTLHALAAAALCGSGFAAHAASLNMVVTSNVASSPPVTQSYSTTTAADLATTHMINTTVTSFGSTAYGWAEGGAGVIRMDSTVHVAARSCTPSWASTSTWPSRCRAA